MEKKQPDFETLAIRTQAPRSSQGEHSTAIHMTSSYLFENAEQARARFAGEEEGNVYSRYSNPTVDEFLKKMTLLEEVEDGVATASGMSAMFLSLVSFLSQGDHMVACRSIFGSTHQVITQILPRWGISHSYVDIDDLQSWERAFTPKTKVLYIETPTNPRLDIIDLQWAADLAHGHGALLVVDNCFATPYLQVPGRFGADVVAHSATKFIDGQGRTLGGAVLGSAKALEEVRFLARHTGPAMSPFNAWVLTKSLETLGVRMDRHCDNALALAKHLDDSGKVQWVRYPFLDSHPQAAIAKRQMKRGGGLVTFEIKSGIQGGKKFLDALNMLSLTANLGDTRSTVTHPASTTHAKLTEEERLAVGISPGLIRISAGLESLEDILQDVDQALEKI